MKQQDLFKRAEHQSNLSFRPVKPVTSLHQWAGKSDTFLSSQEKHWSSDRDCLTQIRSLKKKWRWIELRNMVGKRCMVREKHKPSWIS